MPRSPNPPAGASPSCPVSEVIQLLGRPHMLSVLRLFHETPGPLRFKEVARRLSISPNTLSHRLQELVHVGLLSRRSFNEIPPRVDYEPTQKARELWPIFDELNAWARAHDLRATPLPAASGRTPVVAAP